MNINIAKEVLIKKKCIIKLDVRLESYSARGSDARARSLALEKWHGVAKHEVK